MSEPARTTVAWHGWTWAMPPRDPGEEHRASTPLELLFDLCFVVAVGQASADLHHSLAAGHVWHGLAGYLSVFFAIWWAWMNFSWFASAYDRDDVLYRLLTLVQMAGVLVLATGVDAAFDDGRLHAGHRRLRHHADPADRAVAARRGGRPASAPGRAALRHRSGHHPDRLGGPAGPAAQPGDRVVPGAGRLRGARCRCWPSGPDR